MDKDLVNVPVGDLGSAHLKLEKGKLLADCDLAQGPVSGKVHVELDALKVLDLIAEKVPGKLDDALISIVKAALLA